MGQVIDLIILQEEYTQQYCEHLLNTMIQEFKNCDYISDYFKEDNVSNKLKWLNSNNRRTLGLCEAKPYKHYYVNDPTYINDPYYEEDDYYIDHTYQISLNPNVLKFDESGNKIIKDVLAHELCHTLPGCMNHGVQFHKFAKIIGNKLGYKIDTTADVDASDYFRKYLPKSNYKVKCVDCGNEIDINRLSDPVKNPSKYNCKKCGGSINSYILNSKGEYELFKSYSDEPQYKYFIKCPDCGYISGFKTRNNTFKELLTALLLGHSLKCPKCKKENMFMSVDGTIVDKDTKDNIKGYDEHGFTFYE